MPQNLKNLGGLMPNGIDTESIQLSNYRGKFIVLYCFQSWCPGCHKIGLPSLQQMVSY